MAPSIGELFAEVAGPEPCLGGAGPYEVRIVTNWHRAKEWSAGGRVKRHWRFATLHVHVPSSSPQTSTKASSQAARWLKAEPSISKLYALFESEFAPSPNASAWIFVIRSCASRCKQQNTKRVWLSYKRATHEENWQVMSPFTATLHSIECDRFVINWELKSFKNLIWSFNF